AVRPAAGGVEAHQVAENFDGVEVHRISATARLEPSWPRRKEIIGPESRRCDEAETHPWRAGWSVRPVGEAAALRRSRNALLGGGRRGRGAGGSGRCRRASGCRVLADDLFADTRRLARAAAHVVELGAPHRTLALDFDGGNQRGVGLERALHALAR